MWPLLILGGVAATLALVFRKSPAKTTVAGLESHVATQTSTFTNPLGTKDNVRQPPAASTASATLSGLPGVGPVSLNLAGTGPAPVGVLSPAAAFANATEGQLPSFFLTAAGQAVTSAYQASRGGLTVDGKYGPKTRAAVVADGFPGVPAAPKAYGGTG